MKRISSINLFKKTKSLSMIKKCYGLNWMKKNSNVKVLKNLLKWGEKHFKGWRMKRLTSGQKVKNHRKKRRKSQNKNRRHRKINSNKLLLNVSSRMGMRVKNVKSLFWQIILTKRQDLIQNNKYQVKVNTQRSLRRRQWTIISLLQTLWVRLTNQRKTGKSVLRRSHLYSQAKRLINQKISKITSNRWVKLSLFWKDFVILIYLKTKSKWVKHVRN